jgi:hypothetical protein
VVGHEAIGVEADAEGELELLQIRQIPDIVLLLRKDDLPVVAALDDVMGVTWQYDTRHTGHAHLPVFFCATL